MPKFHVLVNALPALALTFFTATTPGSARAQLVITQISSFTGAFAARVKENADGAEAYFKRINATGGINGQQIEVQRIDDGNDPAKAGKLAEEAAAKPETLALFMPAGTPNTEAISKVTDRVGLPVIAPSTGASIFHTPLRKSIFNLRAPYQLEAAELVRYIHKLQRSKISLLVQDDSFGKDAQIGAMRGLESLKLPAALTKTFDRTKPDVDAVAAAVIAADTDAVVFLGSGAHAALIFKKIREARPHIQFAVISNNATAGFVKSLGTVAHGTYVSQVMPGEQGAAVMLMEMSLDFPGGRDAMSPAHIEGYLGARLTVEALKRAGKRPTRAKIITAMESMSNVDLGGFSVSYSPDNHSGMSYFDLSMINRSGKFMR
jgi:branched-chain amino acid transport system substrate-binding protein